MAFRLAEAFVEFTTKGYELVTGQIAGIQSSLVALAAGAAIPSADFSAMSPPLTAATAAMQALTTATTAIARPSHVAAMNMKQLATSSIQAGQWAKLGAIGMESMAAAANTLTTAMTAVAHSSGVAAMNMQKLAASSIQAGQWAKLGAIGMDNIATDAIVLAGAVPEIAAGFAITGVQVGRIVSQMGILIPELGMMGHLIGGASMAVTRLHDGVKALGETLMVGTAGAYAIIVAIGAVLLAITVMMKKAFAVDPHAQEVFKNIGESINRILQRLGGTMLDALMRFISPLERVLDLFDRITEAIQESTTAMSLLKAAIDSIPGAKLARLADLALAAAGIGKDRSLGPSGYGVPLDESGRPGGGGSPFGFTSLENFGKQFQSAIGSDPLLKETVAQTKLITETNRILSSIPAGKLPGFKPGMVGAAFAP